MAVELAMGNLPNPPSRIVRRLDLHDKNECIQALSAREALELPATDG